MPHKIAIYVGEDLLGDGLLKLPFIRAIRQAFPQSHITWVAGEKQSVYASLLKPCVEDLIDQVIEFGHFENQSVFMEAGPFDIILDTQNDPKVTKWLLKIPHTLFISRTKYFYWSHRKPSFWKRWKKPIHLVDQLLWLGSLAAEKPLSKIIAPLKIPDEYIREAAKILPYGKTYVGIAPGAGQPKKCWPLDNFIAVAKEQLEKQRTPVFILGPNEQSWFSLLREIFPDAQFPLQEYPTCMASPLYTVALAQKFSLAIANDSGTGHLFGAADIPLISLFGPTNSEKLHPLTNKGIVIRAHNSKDIKDIPVSKILQVIEKYFIV